MLGIVKIGHTNRSAEARAREISSATGVPAPYEVAHAERFNDCVAAEKLIHALFKKLRVNQDREFFELSLRDAVRAVKRLAVEVNGTSDGGNEIRKSILRVMCWHCSAGIEIPLTAKTRRVSCPNCFGTTVPGDPNPNAHIPPPGSPNARVSLPEPARPHAKVCVRSDF